ncbi:MAG: hypothetical protein CBC46_10885 [Verrucomicrobiaceae bacterium TMED86]|nr:MAG: hypothetical protein CBC46_10885 [Verrucomicrobiaceae bacterium TMED86]
MGKIKVTKNQTMQTEYSTRTNILSRKSNCEAKMAEQERYLRLLSALLGQSYAESVKTVVTPEALSFHRDLQTN